MNEALVATGTALWLGVLTSISPCPLATNVAAVSFLGARVESPRAVFFGGLLYTLGRIATYVAIAAILVTGLLSAPRLSIALQENMGKAMGPLLLVTGLILLGLIGGLSWSGGRVLEGLRAKAGAAGVWGALPLGALFALSFCPVSAALYFGSLLPLCLARESEWLLPGFYGIGTALPVVGFAIVTALGARWLAKAFDRVTAFEKHARRATAIVFIAVGLYMTLDQTLGVLS